MSPRSREARYQEILRQLLRDFDRRLIEDPRFSESLPGDAYIIIQVDPHGAVSREIQEDIERFNQWVVDIARSQIREGQSVVKAVASLSFRRVPPAQTRTLHPWDIPRPLDQFELTLTTA